MIFGAFVVFVFYFCVVSGSPLRLSGLVRPTRYKIIIHPNIEQGSFTGKVNIYINISFGVESIKFHASNFTIDSIHFSNKKIYDDLSPESLVYRLVEHQLVEIRAGNKSNFPIGSHIIGVTYHGNFSLPSSGLFKTGSTYPNRNATQVVATDLQPSFARTVFPCFDEPSFKAKFHLTLVLPNHNFRAISNTDPYRVYNTSRGVVYRFKTTPVMSTYLLSFAIHQLERGQGEGFHTKISIRVFALDANNKNSQKTISYVDSLLNYFSNYTNVPYPLRKIDMIEFDRVGNTATENWGLITFKTGLLSSRDDIYDDYQKFAVFSHEISHYWFGNLVTNQWWDDIWLQEGFATYLSLKAADVIRNDNSSLYFSKQNLEDIYYFEFENKSLPVVYYQEDPLKIKNSFNDITYTKGAAIIRMIEQVLGENCFRTVIISYMKKFAFKAATTDDFIQILENYYGNGELLRSFLESYLYQSKYPVINVQETNSSYILTQSSLNTSEERPESKWTVPILYFTNLCQSPVLEWFDSLMDHCKSSFIVNESSEKYLLVVIIPKRGEKWLKVNPQLVGVYRVVYSPSLWEKFMKYSDEMSAIEREHLILESTAMFYMDKISCDTVLNYIDSIFQKGMTIDTNVVFATFSRMRLKFQEPQAKKLLVSFFKKLWIKSGDFVLAHAFNNKDVPLTNETEAPAQPHTVKQCLEWLTQMGTRVV